MTVFQEMGNESKLLNQIQWSWYAEDALFNDVKNITLLDRRVLKIHRFLGTPGMIWHSWVSS